MTGAELQPPFGAPARSWWPVVLVWSCLVLLPVGRMVEVPVLSMALGGVVLLVRHRRALLDVTATRTLVMVFLAMWLPMVLSLPDAVNLPGSALVVVNHLRFLFAGVFMAWALAPCAARRRLLALCGWLLAFWLFDAWVQVVAGVDLIGQEPWLAGISAMYGSSSSKFGTTFAVICPLLFAFVQRRAPPWALVLVVLASVYIVMSAGSRTAWMSLAVVVCVYAWGNRAWIRSLGPRVLAAAITLSLLLPVLAYALSPPFQRRVDQSLGELTGRIDVAVSPLGHRVWIWKGAASMIAAHPVNGVGARGFRYAFPDHAAPGDPFVAMTPPLLPTHSHQLLLEVAAETGVPGLLGLVLAVIVLVRAGYRMDAPGRHALLPFTAGLSAGFFPLNTHLAIYSAHWSQIVWWLLGAYCAHLWAADPAPGVKASGHPCPPPRPPGPAPG